MNLFENLQLMKESQTNLNFKEIDKKLDKFAGQITIDKQYEQELKKYLNKKHISYLIDDRKLNKLTFKLKYENLQNLKEFDKLIKVSNKNYKRTLKEINDVISSVSQKELIPKQCNEIIEDIYYKVIELKNMFTNEDENKSIEDLKDAIDLAYNYTTFDSYVEDFITSHGVSEDSETIFDGMLDEDVIKLYDTLRDKLIKHYGPDYNELDSRVYDAFNLMI